MWCSKEVVGRTIFFPIITYFSHTFPLIATQFYTLFYHTDGSLHVNFHSDIFNSSWEIRDQSVFWKGFLRGMCVFNSDLSYYCMYDPPTFHTDPQDVEVLSLQFSVWHLPQFLINLNLKLYFTAGTALSSFTLRSVNSSYSQPDCMMDG